MSLVAPIPLQSHWLQSLEWADPAPQTCTPWCHTVPKAEACLGPACPCPTARAPTVTWENRAAPSGLREWQGQEHSSGLRLQHSMATLMLGGTCCYVHQVL